MADFQAAIGNIIATPTLITVDDTTDYAGSTQDGHLTADFSDYRKIVMTNPKRTFVYSTEGDGDVITSAANAAVLTFNFSIEDEDIDGVYDLTLYTVPTWNATPTYDRHEAVYLSGILYKSKINGNTGNTPSTSSDWIEIDDSLIPSKYCVTDSIIITDIKLLGCYEKLVADAICELENDLCGDMCNNKDFMDAMKMRLLIDSICHAASNNDFDGARKKFNLVNRLC